MGSIRVASVAYTVGPASEMTCPVRVLGGAIFLGMGEDVESVMGGSEGW